MRKDVGVANSIYFPSWQWHVAANIEIQNFIVLNKSQSSVGFCYCFICLATAVVLVVQME